MLGNTSYSLAQIGELMGFSSPSYFSQCFRKAGHDPQRIPPSDAAGKTPRPDKTA